MPIRNVIGIDLGVKDLLAISDGTIIKNMKFIDKYEKKLKGLNRWLSRCQKGSKNREKVKIKIQEVYSKLKNARKYFLHKTSKQLVEENCALFDILWTHRIEGRLEKIQEIKLNEKIK